MTLRSIVATIVLLIATPAHAYLFGPSCNGPETIKAFIAEAQCALVMCRAGAPQQFRRPRSRLSVRRS